MCDLIDIVEKLVISEMPTAKVGNWQGGESHVGAISSFMYEKEWQTVDQMDISGEVYDVAKLKSNDAENARSFIIGRMQTTSRGMKPGLSKDEFSIIVRLDMTLVPEYSFLGYHNLHEIDGITVEKNNRGAGLASMMYKWLIDNGIVLISDHEQYFGGRKLWASLARLVDIVVDVVDLDKQQILEKNVVIHHGKEDHEFDPKYYSYDETKRAHIRFVMKKISLG